MAVDDLDSLTKKTQCIKFPAMVESTHNGNNSERIFGSSNMEGGYLHNVNVAWVDWQKEMTNLSLSNFLGPDVSTPIASLVSHRTHDNQGKRYSRKEKGKSKLNGGRSITQATPRNGDIRFHPYQFKEAKTRDVEGMWSIEVHHKSLEAARTTEGQPRRKDFNALVWNCQGLAHSRSVHEPAEMVGIHRPELVGLQEMKINENRLIDIRRRLGLKNDFQVPRQGLEGGLALWWKEEVTLTILSYSKYHIDAFVEGEEIIRVTVIYGEPISARRGVKWELLKRLHSQYNLPWNFFGDFNEVCFLWEVKGGRVRGEWQIRAFREALTDCGLTDLGYKGNPFTFSNRRSGGKEIRARLDRMLANNNWGRIFPNVQVSHISVISLDHNFLLFNRTRRERRMDDKRLRFEPMWIRNVGFGDVVTAAWNDSGDLGTTLTDGLNNCSTVLAKWNNEKFGKVGKRIKDLKAELESVRLLDRDMVTIAKEADIVEEIDEWRLWEEILWRQRSRAKWLREGDKNTSYFHAKATQRKKSNMISKLQNKEGDWITEEAQLGELIKEYFTDIFSINKDSLKDEQDRSYNSVQRKVTTKMAEKLCEPVKELEIQAAVFQMAPTKAPGPEGFHALFYQMFWYTIKDKVIDTILRVFEDGKLEECMNETLVVLIPKNRKIEESGGV